VKDGETRDELLGAALRELEVPEHEPEFEQELRRRLAAERQAGRSGSVGMGLRRPGRWHVAAAAAAATALVLLVVPAVFPRGGDTASAAEVRATVVRALARAQALSGLLIVRERGTEGLDPRGVRWSFVLTERGDFRLTGVTHPTDLAYDASRNVEHYSDEGLFTTRTGIAPGEPDSSSADYVIQRGLGAVVAALEEEGDVRVEDVEYRGRPAWLLRTGTGNEGDLREITVDRGTGLPVRDRLFHQGTLLNETLIDHLRVNPQLRPGTFSLERKPGQQPSGFDAGFRRVRLVQVPRVVGYDPLVPVWVPAGFRLAQVAVADRSRRTGNEQRQNPPSRGVVSLAYRRGLDEIVVTTRLTGRRRAAWSDPVTVGLLAGRPEPIAFSRGALAGARGELVIDPGVVPHVWALTDRLVVTVAGNLGRTELRRVAESLR
jgi:hypothetical protein